jgi:5-methylcytosine-specific restriction enzyme subunit McrC
MEVQVVPKLVGGNLGVLQMIDYSSGLGALRRSKGVRQISAEGASLIDLICLLLGEECERLTRQGLIHDYVEREDSLPRLRGKLLIRQQATKRYGQINALECSFEEFEADTLENRILAAALGVGRRIAQFPPVRTSLSRLHTIFSEVCEAKELDIVSARGELSYHRRNAHYRPAHELAWLVLEARGIQNIFERGPQESFSFLIDMNLLFERFVTRLFEEAFRGGTVRVLPQRKDRSIVMNERTGRPYSAITPDLLLEWGPVTRRRRVPVDMKYKLYDDRKADPHDVYQTFFYAYAYRGESDLPMAFIVYPAGAQSTGFNLLVQSAGGVQTARVLAVGLDVPKAISDLQSGVSSTELIGSVLPNQITAAVAADAPFSR